MAIDLSKYGLLVSQGDKQQALYQGLLGLGSQLMAGSAPSTQPGGFGRGMAAGGQAFQQGYRGYLNDAIGKQMQGLQAVNMQQQMESQQAEAERKAQQQLARDRIVNTAKMNGRDMSGRQIPQGEVMANYAQAYPDKWGEASINDMMRKPEYDWAVGPDGKPVYAEKDKIAQGGFAPYEKAPNLLSEWLAAKKQGFRGNMADWAQARKSPSVVVNAGQNDGVWGKPPAGHVWAMKDGAIATEATKEGYQRPIAVPVAGSAEDAKRAGATQAAEQSKKLKEATADVVSDDVGRALSLVTDSPIMTTGFLGSKLSSVDGTDAGDLSKLLAGVKANIGFDRLQQMRESSKTGGALGSVSENENKLLQSVYGSIEQSQSADQLAYNLRRFFNVYNDIIHGAGAGPVRYDLKTGKSVNPVEAHKSELRKKYGLEF